MISLILAVIEDRPMDELCDMVRPLTAEQAETLREIVNALIARVERERAEAAASARKSALIEITAWAAERMG